MEINEFLKHKQKIIIELIHKGSHKKIRMLDSYYDTVTRIQLANCVIITCDNQDLIIEKEFISYSTQFSSVGEVMFELNESFFNLTEESYFALCTLYDIKINYENLELIMQVHSKLMR